MTVVILVAGRGTRFRDTKAKCLIEVMGVSLLNRTISLIRDVDGMMPIKIITGHNNKAIEKHVKKLDYEDIEIIRNEDYAIDQNILSAQLGMKNVETDVLVIEGDCIYNFATMDLILKNIGSNKNIIFTKGQVDLKRKNAIIKSDQNGNFEDYIIGEKKNTMQIKNWSNMIGCVLFSQKNLDKIMKWLEETGNNPSSSYYFAPLIDSKKDLSVEVLHLGEEHEVFSFNTQAEYLNIMSEMGVKTTIQMIEVEFLKHVEGFSKKRVVWLKEKILREGIWNKPICVDNEYGIVMDGNHRMEVAKALRMKKIPAILFDHSEVKFWSLRKNQIVNLERIINKSLSGDIYPYKTVKYEFPLDIPICSINVEEMM